MKKSLYSAAVVTALSLTLLGCSAAETPEKPENTTATEQQTEAPETEAPETPAAEEPAAAGDMPEWAEGSLDVGEKVGEISLDSWKVELFQVGTATTDKDSMFVDKESGENLLPKGSEVVYVNFVFTNTSDAPINLGASIGSPQLQSSTWKYLGGQPSFSDRDAYEALKISDDAKQTGFDKPYVVAPGQSFAQATNIAYVPGDKVTAEVRLTPIDDEGDLLHDDKQEGETEITIK